MASQNINWSAFTKKYPDKLVAALRGHIARGPFRITAHRLAIEANVADASATDLLRELVQNGFLKSDKKLICPCERMESLTAEQAAEDVCAFCGRAFEIDVPARPVELIEFVHAAKQTRDVRWLLALHGMNTQGAWQETFNWLVSRTYRRSVPVAIYKYGVVRPGAIVKFRQRALVRELTGRIRRLSGQSEETGFGGTPDVIAHSLGTWLLGHALVEDATLRVGRVILLGCILRPDFDWELLLRRKQVESVLCHVATSDFWAGIAHYFIPDSGPSGRSGFNDRNNVGHVALVGKHHSDFFKEAEMPTLFERVWQPFLTQAAGESMPASNVLPVRSWRQTWWPLRATVMRWLLLAAIGGFVLVILLGLSLGLADLWRLI